MQSTVSSPRPFAPWNALLLCGVESSGQRAQHSRGRGGGGLTPPVASGIPEVADVRLHVGCVAAVGLVVRIGIARISGA